MEQRDSASWNTVVFAVIVLTSLMLALMKMQFIQYQREKLQEEAVQYVRQQLPPTAMESEDAVLFLVTGPREVLELESIRSQFNEAVLSYCEQCDGTIASNKLIPSNNVDGTINGELNWALMATIKK